MALTLKYLSLVSCKIYLMDLRKAFYFKLSIAVYLQTEFAFIADLQQFGRLILLKPTWAEFLWILPPNQKISYRNQVLYCHYVSLNTQFCLLKTQLVAPAFESFVMTKLWIQLSNFTLLLQFKTEFSKQSHLHLENSLKLIDFSSNECWLQNFAYFVSSHFTLELKHWSSEFLMFEKTVSCLWNFKASDESLIAYLNQNI